MTDQEYKLEIIKKHITMMTDDELDQEIMRCMEEWAGVISARIDESDADEEYNEKFR
jgi:hypothetical protein